MLKSIPETPRSEFDLAVFQAVVPQDHYLRKVMACINFEAFRPRLIGSYDADFGRPAIDPVRMLKILFLRFHYRLSDRQVMERTVTDMAFRWFLSLGVHAEIPNHTNGTHFRQRLGAESFQQVFQDLITQAREHGLVRDRLRLKDATHLFADVAKVGPLPLVAQGRERLLQAAEPLFAEWVGQTSRPRQHNTHPTATQFTFKAESCAACPLREQCFPNPARKTGRTVVKNDYQAEYDKVQAKAKTTEYEQTRRVHPKIERKLNELARHHRCRRACFRGKPKVLVQALLTALVVNIKRIVNLLARSAPWPMPTVAVRAQEAGS